MIEIAVQTPRSVKTKEQEVLQQLEQSLRCRL